MANINKDYLVIADLKSSKVTAPAMVGYNTDKRIFNIFAKLKISMSSNPDITVFVGREDANNYSVKLTVIKPTTKQLRYATGELMSSGTIGNGAVYQFDLGEEFTDQVGKYICEFTVTCTVNGFEEIVTCDPFTYTIKPSAVTGLNPELERTVELPILEQLINEVKEVKKDIEEGTLADYQTRTDDNLQTENKEIVAAINELKATSGDLSSDKIATDLTTDDDTKVLSAKQGKVLQDTKVEVVRDGLEQVGLPMNTYPDLKTSNKTLIGGINEVVNQVTVIEETKVDIIEDELNQRAISDNVHSNLNTTNKTVIGGINEVNAQLQTVAKKTGDINTLSQFENMAKAIENGGEIIVPKNPASESILANISKPFILKGQGEQATTIKPIGSITPFQTTSLYSMGFKNLKIDCGDLTSDHIIDYNGSDNRIHLDNVFLVNVKNNGIRAKSGFTNIFRDCYIYGVSNKKTGIGLQLGKDSGDWQNINTFFNSNIVNFDTGILLKNSVLNNFIGIHIAYTNKAIHIDTNSPNPTRDINIEGCYFEQNGVGIYSNPLSKITNMNIKKCYFACDTLMDLKNIEGLSIEDCSYAENYPSQTGNVLLSSISNLIIKNKNNMIFKTHKGNPIILGEHDICENRIQSSNKATSYNINGSDLANSSDSKNEYTGRIIDSFSLNNNSLQHIISKRLVYSASDGLGGNYLSSRLIGFSGMFKPSSDCNIKILIQSEDTLEKYVLLNKDLQGGVFNKVEGVGITGIFNNKNNIQIAYVVTKKQTSDTLKLAFDEIQVWYDYYNKPKYIRNDTNYIITSRPSKLIVNDITDAKGTFVLAGEEIIKTNSSVFTTETTNKWLVNKSGFIKNGLFAWTSNTTYGRGDYCYTSNGCLIKCVEGGVSANTEPTVSSISQIIQDNTVKWISVTSSDVSATTVAKTYS